ncbi:MAG: hypothetical protein R3C26_19800 [Calditrichia bacterium]
MPHPFWGNPQRNGSQPELHGGAHSTVFMFAGGGAQLFEHGVAALSN